MNTKSFKNQVVTSQSIEDNLILPKKNICISYHVFT